MEHWPASQRRDDVVPQAFLQSLRVTLQGFSHESVRHQTALAKMIWECDSRWRAHEALNNWATFTWQELEEAFGRGKFVEVNARLQVFEVTSNWSREDRLTKAYRLAQPIRELRRHFLFFRPRDTSQLMGGDGKILRTLPAVVASKDAKGITVTDWRRATCMMQPTPVNVQSLEDLQDWLRKMAPLSASGLALPDQDTALPVPERLMQLAEAAGQILHLAMTDLAGAGFLWQRYVQATSGRLYARGINLQNAPALIKQAALAGLWEYDFANCHYTLLAQMAARYGYQCSAIAAYLADKRGTRAEIAARAGISVDQAKTCLLAVAYGARRSEWDRGAIPTTVGIDAARRLYDCERFNAIAEDILGARRVILQGWPRTPNGRLKNEFGRAISSDAKPAQQLAHLLQGAEAVALLVAVTMYPREIVLLQHDGFASSSCLDAGAIEAAVEARTGYRLSLEACTIEVDRYGYFRK